MNTERIKYLNKIPVKKGAVIYWMQREGRVNSNPALIHAYNISRKTQSPLFVVFCLTHNYLNAQLRQYDFMLKGLEQLESKLNELKVNLVVLKGNPAEKIPEYIQRVNAGALVSDFNPLKIVRNWKNKIAENVNVSFCVVDAHNVVPCWISSDKQEYAAYTIRKKINKILPEFLYEKFDELKPHPHNGKIIKNNWDEIYENLNCSKNVLPVNNVISGEKQSEKVLDDFINHGLNIYEEKSNNPNENALSGLSPYLHFGQIYAKHVALKVINSSADEINKGAFLEQLIIRKELSDNYCYYNEDYDNIHGLPDWALKTHQIHVIDKREFIYSRDEFERADTHDDLWNAAQKQLVKTGIIHSYMRMYWAKKILEWTQTPEQAIDFAIYLNDKYSLDGRDPNGYTGIMWSIGGVHDRPWPERPVFGKVRYMNYAGCKRKFDVNGYINNNSD